MARDLYEVTDEGELLLHLHAGQWRAWSSPARFVAIIAGTQSGKTSFLPHWLYREISQCGPGDYLMASPTFRLMEVKALPEFRRLFEETLQLGTFQRSPVQKFTFSEAGARAAFGDRYRKGQPPTQVFFGHAQNPDSLESATYKAAVLDEAGQKKFKQGSWEAILRRLSIARGRALIGTTPYDLGWLKSQIHDRWQKGDPDYEVVRFDSTENPQFSREEFEYARRVLPAWRFDMFYRGIFSRPAGQIYTAFDSTKHVIPRFEIDDDWPRIVGWDFGQVNTAAVFLAQEPGTRRLVAYKEYHAGGRTAAEHLAVTMADERRRQRRPGQPIGVSKWDIRACGGAPSEDDWRDEFLGAGLYIEQPPISDVEVGIDRVYGCFARDELYFFSDLERTIAQVNDYTREVDDAGEPLEKIEDKHRFHLADALRYAVVPIRTAPGPKASVQTVSYGSAPRQPAAQGADNLWDLLEPENTPFSTTSPSVRGRRAS